MGAFDVLNKEFKQMYFFFIDIGQSVFTNIILPVNVQHVDQQDQQRVMLYLKLLIV